jgi:uncharacterized protein YcbX
LNEEIGTISRIFRYPIKSMAGVALETSSLGWDGLEGDRRFAFRRIVDRGGFPFLTASRLPELLLFKPEGQSEHDPMLPTHVRTPDGRTLQINSEELRADVERKHGSAVELMQFKHGIFDEAPLSLISMTTILEIERQSGRDLDVRRFRPNIIVDTPGLEPFGEDGWLGRSLSFGAEANSPTVNIAMRDTRCVMINLDPDTAEADAIVMKTAVRLNTNHAGVYATVTSTGELAVGQKVYLR